ncbi:hypothetical protein PL335_06500 [Sulfitobacter faviae]|uniref:hypothetical protein n=1 Tax=Sulfitobacter faviae TaxID=1775881 RepID=UPI002306E87B|nr:hypothetical protein [Sulfitobacter faviae]WCE67992.1 hypothetical protein PL335_06500 [Sulfitobacter faviae]
MFGLSHLHAQLIAAGAGVAILIGVVVWLRADAADDRERDLRANQNTNRLQHIEESKGTQNEVEGLTDDDLDSALCRVLSSPAECERRRAVQRREPAATKGAARYD